MPSQRASCDHACRGGRQRPQTDRKPPCIPVEGSFTQIFTLVVQCRAPLGFDVILRSITINDPGERPPLGERTRRISLATLALNYFIKRINDTTDRPSTCKVCPNYVRTDCQTI